jgi:hypothetical protein
MRRRKKLKIELSPVNSALLMAKTSWINRNQRKRATVKKYAAVRAELKAKKNYAGLAQLPRDASPTRVVNRCEVTGLAARSSAGSKFPVSLFASSLPRD